MSLIDIVAIEGYIQTTYLAVYPDKLLLLDAGCRCDVESILRYITDTLQRPLTDLKTVMVSHMHPDHAGGAMQLKQKTGCVIASGMSHKPWYQGLKGRIRHLNDLALTYYVASRQGRGISYLWYSPILKADITVKEGDNVPGFEDWKVIETPGHTNCDISLWHKPSHQVYTADLILKIKNKFTVPYLMMLPNLYRASLIKIKELEVDKVLLAHGEKVCIENADFEQLLQQIPKQPRSVTIFQGLNIRLPQLRFARKRAGKS